MTPTQYPYYLTGVYVKDAGHAPKPEYKKGPG